MSHINAKNQWTDEESFIKLDFGWFCWGSITVQETAARLNRWRAVLWKCERYLRRTDCIFIFLTFSAFFSDIYCHTLLIGQRPPFICLHLFLSWTCFTHFEIHTNVFTRIGLSKHFYQGVDLVRVQIKTVFNTTFMYIYVVSRNTVISTQFRYKQLTTKIAYCGFLIFASSQFR